jgi:isopentenyl-diphosphate delta-isomerase
MRARAPELAGQVARAAESADIQGRKADHLDLCAGDQVGYRGVTTLLECVRLLHQSLPELSADEVTTEVELFGRRLRAPLVIAGMTGGHERAADINRSLARVAQEHGLAFGLGSQRAMHRDPDLEWTYRVREWAPDVLLFGNIGVVQARDTSTTALDALVTDVGADALCVHLNPAMELVQSEGDRDFRGCVAAIERLCNELCVPIIVKETGNGMSPQTIDALVKAGVTTVDTSGAGGTSWVGVETMRADGVRRAVGERLWDWGVPTAASVHYAVEASLTTIATGGIRSGLDVARALALGASAAGMAAPLLRAFTRNGEEGLRAALAEVLGELRAVMLLTGARDVQALRTAPRVVVGELLQWMAATGRSR